MIIYACGEVKEMGVHYITAVDQRRRADWRRIFGDDRLPVKTPRPRWQALEPGRHETLAYDLDVQALHPMQRKRLASKLATVNGLRLDEAERMVETHPIPILARGCELVEVGEEANVG